MQHELSGAAAPQLSSWWQWRFPRASKRRQVGLGKGGRYGGSVELQKHPRNLVVCGVYSQNYGGETLGGLVETRQLWAQKLRSCCFLPRGEEST